MQKFLERIDMETSTAVSTSAYPNLNQGDIMQNKGLVFPCREAIASLMNLVIGTCSDICYVVGNVSPYLENPAGGQVESISQTNIGVFTRHIKLRYTRILSR